MSKPDQLRVYAIRVSEDARRQNDAELVRIFDAVGEDAAVSWRNGMAEAVASLTTLPGRCPPALENAVYQQSHPGVTLRQLLYRRRSGIAWRFLFTLHEQFANDLAIVRVHQVRYEVQTALKQWINDKANTDV